MTKELVKINASDYGLEEIKAREIELMFIPMLSKMTELEDKYNEILKLELTGETCAMAKQLRLQYVKIRTGTAEIHKKAKDFYLKGGRFVDGWKNAQLFASQEKEETLEKIEKHFENAEKERKARLRDEREKLIAPYVESTATLILAEMSDEAFTLLLNGAKQQHEARIAAEKQAEENRLKEIEAERIKQEKIRKENIRLKKEAEEKEKALEAEREQVRKEAEERDRLAEIERKKQADILAKERAKAEAERRERERLEAEIERKKQSDLKAQEAEKKAQIAADKKAARAPDKIKIHNLSETIGKIELPEVKSDEAKQIIESTKILLQKIVMYLNEKTESL